MGTWFSCSFADFDDLDTRFKGYARSVSFNGRDSEPATTLLKSYRSAKFAFERSLSLKSKKVPEKRMSRDRDFGSPKTPRSVAMSEEKTPEIARPGKERIQAALKLQKVYKSFRTRRRLADCAIMAEQRWWKLLDFAELKRSSISFFDIEKPETAISRWSRARTKAAKVGKGLSKDEKARKLALQHWLEAIDPRHRYGHNLQFFYVKWLHCESKEPFFYWLDIGEGKEVNLEICPRSKLQQQCIKYLGPTERKTYEVALWDGRFVYEQSGKVVDTSEGPRDAKWIFVLSTSKTLYVGMKSKGTFQHSSFLAGGATLSAGRLVVEDGILKAVWPHSGHYLPTEENFQEFMTFLKEHNVDLTNVKKNPDDEEDGGGYEKTRIDSTSEENPKNPDQRTRVNEPSPPVTTKLPRVLSSKMISKLEIPNFDSVDVSEEDDKEGYETAEETFLTEEDFMVPKLNLFGDEEKPAIPKEKIMERIDSHKGMKSYQLARHLTTRWSTGAGPRIGCMRDYPSELQFRVLEQANLSPRSTGNSTFSSPKNLSRFNQNSLDLDTTSTEFSSSPKLAK